MARPPEEKGVSRSKQTLVPPPGKDGEDDAMLDSSRPGEYLVPQSGERLDVESIPGPAPARTIASKSPGGFGYQGTFLSEDVVLPGSLEVIADTVVLWANGTQLASWSYPACKVRRMGPSQFSIEAEGEMITFTPDDPEGLNGAVKVFLDSYAEGPRAAVAATPGVALTPPGSRPVLSQREIPAGGSAAEQALLEQSLVEQVLLEQVLLEQALLEQSGLEQTGGPGVLEPGQIEDPDEVPPPRTHRRRPRVKAHKATSKRVDHDQESLQSVAIEPDEGPAAAIVVAAGPLTADPETATPTIADRITENAKRRFRSAKAHRWLKSDIEQVAIKTGVIASAIGILTLFAVTVFIIAGGFRGEPEVVTVARTTVPAPTTTLTTVVATTLLPLPATTLFQTEPGELTARWNALAEQSRPELTLFNDLTSPFLVSLTPFITMEGVLDPAAGSVVLRATPTGAPEGDGLILTSLGLLIGVADPSIDGPDRRGLLETLGLSIQDPQLGGLNGSATHNGLAYHLVFVPETGALEFRITPEGAATTTTPTIAP